MLDKATRRHVVRLKVQSVKCADWPSSGFRSCFPVCLRSNTLESPSLWWNVNCSHLLLVISVNLVLLWIGFGSMFFYFSLFGVIAGEQHQYLLQRKFYFRIFTHWCSRWKYCLVRGFVHLGDGFLIFSAASSDAEMSPCNIYVVDNNGKCFPVKKQPVWVCFRVEWGRGFQRFLVFDLPQQRRCSGPRACPRFLHLIGSEQRQRRANTADPKQHGSPPSKHRPLTCCLSFRL